VSDEGLPGWGHPPARRRGRCPQCGGPTEVTVVTQATTRVKGTTRSLESTSVALCNTHALELFAELQATMNARRSA
jgi:hypothetical protein